MNKVQELTDLAVGRYLDKIDFDVMDYLNEKEQIEYAIAFKKENGYCISGICDDSECDEDCLTMKKVVSN